MLADYPDLEPEDIQQAVSYTAWLGQEEVVTATVPRIAKKTNV